jgi:hypothetical protein
MLPFASQTGRRTDGHHPVDHVLFIRLVKAVIIMLRKSCCGFLFFPG